MKGFTWIEIMIVIAIMGILTAIILPAIFGSPSRQPRQLDGTICIGGYKFTASTHTQVIGANGGGVPCDNVSGDFNGERGR